ncbi:Delta(24)-sterol C-methyltransferase [Candidozyma auris]|uniref:Sterol 24-C-methyltransferase n=2 Tax=Candidozyma auris TaxID=498019 RepID=A0AB36VYM5_CANAR|nr:sterol_24-C-methyltransferase [[Candida] auris]KND99447.1 sterol 24-c-methyltransferase [[Candida] auris]PIS48640.1 sterol 24-C-methyltransferase [[Candida] auris]PIS49252.1 sterol 24-C-methyltransferase [[Candida] auris]PSK76780.1 sterol 24-C-methyltransferase [[Candida] auris]QEO23231.1 sterol_24-C-methyltransferase [[Candida] auris]
MSSTVPLAEKDHARDQEFAKALHGNSYKKTGLGALMSKSKDAADVANNGYFKHWDGGVTEEDEKKRLGDYSQLTSHYYNLVTDFYEYGWGSSFHFSRYYRGEAFRQATARHEHYLAYKMGLTEDMKVLDVGCGVGGPGREICRFTDCTIVGLNNNDYQIERANHYAKKYHLDDKLSYVKGDFMQMDFEPESFDAVYAIEATVHAPVLEGVYSEIYRVLKPGGVFGVYEWVMTDKYDESNEEHRKIAYGIEVGDGIPKMYKRDVAEQALKNVGFEIEYQKDLAAADDEIPWYYPLSGQFKYVQTLGDYFTVFRTSRIGRTVTTELVGLMEKIGLAPKGSKQVTGALEDAAVNLVKGGEQKLFTPMMLYVVRKPKNA